MTSRVRVFMLFTAAYFMSYFYRSTNAVIAPDLVADVGLNAARLGLMTSLFFAVLAASADSPWASGWTAGVRAGSRRC
ncbi:MAG: hypothetical protein R3A10_20260 [Caldilineaceae bacterium]